MIIEGAFLKLPELLLGSSASRRHYEATLVSHLAMGVLLELNARSISIPMHRIHIERAYNDSTKSRTPGRADLYVDLSGIYAVGRWYELYGMKSHNWIEAKHFSGIKNKGDSQKKTMHAASIALDLLRLCLFVKEERSKNRDRGRYLLLVFNRRPEDYLSLTRRSAEYSERQWLQNLLLPGENEIELSVAEEPSIFRKVFFKRASDTDDQLKLKLRISTLSFSPSRESSVYLYWGYLIRIIDFELSCFDKSLIYKDASQEFWTLDQEETQTWLIQRLMPLQ